MTWTCPKCKTTVSGETHRELADAISTHLDGCTS
jgi:hypothetical protein